jgi:hypothetical protein
MGRNKTLTTIENYKYEIDENLSVRMWDLNLPDEEGRPFLFQPTNPDGNDWVNKEEVEQWAISFIAELMKPAEIAEEVTE